MKREEALTLFVVTTIEQLDNRTLLKVEGRLIVLNFLVFDEDIQHLKDVLQPLTKDLIFINGEEALREAEPKIRSKFLEFCGEFPNRGVFSGRNLVEVLRWDSLFSLWWLTDFSIKDNEADDLFEILIMFECIRTVSERFGCKEWVYFGSEIELSSLLSQYCAIYGFRFTAFLRAPKKLKKKNVWIGTLKWLYLYLTLLVLWLLAIVIMSKRPQKGAGNLEAAVVGLFTIYPTTLRYDPQRAKYVDRNFVRLPEIFADSSNLTPKFVVWFRIGLRSVAHILRLQKSDEIVLLLSYLRRRDFIDLLRYPTLIWRIRSSILSSDFSRAATFEGLDISRLVQRRILNCLLGVTVLSNLVAYKAFQKLRLNLNLKAFIQFLDTFPLGAASFVGLKANAEDVVTFGYQHASVNKYKLWHQMTTREARHRPKPDYYICQGRSYFDSLSQVGIPTKKILATGSPRYERLCEVRGSLKQKHFNSDFLSVGNHGKKLVTVAPSLSKRDANELIKAIIKVAKDMGSLVLHFLEHPDQPIGDMVRKHAQLLKFTDWYLYRGDVYSLLSCSDLVVTSYSTIGDEAIALSTPVVSFVGMRPPMSQFSAIAAAPVARSETGLREAVSRMLFDAEYSSKFKDRWEMLLEYSFYGPRPQASESIVAEIVRCVTV